MVHLPAVVNELKSLYSYAASGLASEAKLRLVRIGLKLTLVFLSLFLSLLKPPRPGSCEDMSAMDMVALVSSCPAMSVLQAPRTAVLKVYLLPTITELVLPGR